MEHIVKIFSLEFELSFDYICSIRNSNLEFEVFLKLLQSTQNLKKSEYGISNSIGADKERSRLGWFWTSRMA